MKLQDKYCIFIRDLIPNSLVVGLLVIRDHEGKEERFNTVLGTMSKKKVAVNIKSISSRSLQIEINWEDKSFLFPLFCPLNKSPDEVFRIFSLQVQEKVSAKYTNEELIKFETDRKERWNK
tara:strand:+ start:28728 stop:29090 length:363 start_codon:yes stop_codon:yes gene_type:complete